MEAAFIFLSADVRASALSRLRPATPMRPLAVDG